MLIMVIMAFRKAGLKFTG